jgi:hypothetical protein
MRADAVTSENDDDCRRSPAEFESTALLRRVRERADNLNCENDCGKSAQCALSH